MSILHENIKELIRLVEESSGILRENPSAEKSLSDRLSLIVQKKDEILRYSELSKKRIEELHSIIEVLNLYRNMSIKANQSDSIIEILRYLCRSFLKISFCTGSVIFFYNKENGQLKKVLARGIDEDEQKRMIHIISMQRPVLEKPVRTYYVLPMIEDEKDKKKEVTLIFVPLIAEEDVFGICVLKADKASMELFDNTLRIIQSMADMISLIIEHQRLIKRNEILSVTDVLTGLYNSRYLESILDELDEGIWSKEAPISMIFLDLDGFKSINDNYGHKFGSAAIREVSFIISESAGKYKAFRYGGDEFVILLYQTGMDTAFEAAELIRKDIEAAVFLKDYNISAKLTASLGVSSFPSHSKSLKSLFADADNMMYRAKALGKNQVFLMKTE